MRVLQVTTHLRLLRLVERMRRAVAIEYGVPLSRLTPRQAFVSRITGATDAAIYTQRHGCLLYTSPSPRD